MKDNLLLIFKIQVMENSEKIKELNDKHRENIPTSKTVITSGINNLWEENVYKIIQEVRYFDNFKKWNDPFFEHDFWSFHFKDYKIYWKIDYFNKDYSFGSEDPSDIVITSRLLTIMLNDEY